MSELHNEVGEIETVIRNYLDGMVFADAAKLRREHETAQASGFTVVEVSPLLGGRQDFFCLDNVHMKEPYHRLMAKEWLKLLVGARGAALGD